MNNKYFWQEIDQRKALQGQAFNIVWWIRDKDNIFLAEVYNKKMIDQLIAIGFLEKEPLDKMKLKDFVRSLK